MNNKYAQFFAILKKNGLEKEDVISEFTKGRTSSLTDLTVGEFAELMRRLQRFNGLPAGNAMRQKMYRIAKNMQWGDSKADRLSMLDGWCLNQKFRKKLNHLTEAELRIMVTVFESKVYPSYLEGLNK